MKQLKNFPKRPPMGVPFLLAALTLHAQSPQAPLAPTPPMGWNSWDAYGTTIDEATFRSSAAWVAKNLLPFGYRYVTIDEAWFETDPIPQGGRNPPHVSLDRNGRYLPDPVRYPSAANGAGLAPLAAYIHSLGLQFGIHVLQGIPREAVERNLPIDRTTFTAQQAANPASGCQWNHDNFDLQVTPAGQAYYDSILRLYASWGVDLIKIDCIASNPYKADEVRMIHQAVLASGRPILLSLSPGEPPIDQAANLQQYAQQWRISNDIWDLWHNDQPYPQGVNDQFPRLAQWISTQQPGHWPDADMLPLGRLGPAPGWGQPRTSRLTGQEAHSLFNLWAIFRSPLMYGGDPAATDPATLALLTNPDIIEIDQHSRHNKCALLTDALALWTADSETGPDRYVAIFNRLDTPQTIHLDRTALGFSPAAYSTEDLWTRARQPPHATLDLTLAPHASQVLRLTPRR